MIAVEVKINGKRQCLAGAEGLTSLSVAFFIKGPMTSDAKDLEYRLHIGGVAADEEVVSRHMTWGTRIPAIEVGDTLSVRVVDVPPHATDAPDSDSDPERDAFHAAKAKYLQLKPKYEP